MKSADRTKLTNALRGHVAAIAEDLRAQMRAPGLVRDRARKLHTDEQVGEDFDVWTDLLSRRAAVLWVLKSVYVRVLEDHGLVKPGRLFDPETQQLFERLAPNLGETAFLRWVYRDLASPTGGLPELFAPQPAEVCAPADELSRKLIQFWRNKDPDSGAFWSFAEERFEGELMGDLYQELDPVVKDRFALCQTPDFVRAFMLDRTLTPAIEEFGAAQVRLLDPACGSGHFLIDGLKRLVDATMEAEPAWDRRQVVEHCLDRVVGIDLNDYACALARARLLMTAADLAGIEALAEAAELSPHVYWADGLEQVEEGLDTRGEQLGLFEKKAEPVSSLTRPEVRAALRDVLEPRFHAVLANPPYITEKDKARKEYHRQKIGKRRRYVSAYREYSLASPFTERCFQTAVDGGFVGLITSNNFMKREFGKALIEDFFTQVDLSLVCDTSQAFIPFHGTPTVLLFGRNQTPSSETVRAVMGRRGETGTPDDPAKGRVWTSIADGWGEPGFENEFVTVADVPHETFDKHPWSLSGGGATGLKTELESAQAKVLGDVTNDIGFVSMTRADDVYFAPKRALERAGLTQNHIIENVEGEAVRDWAITGPSTSAFPYDPALRPVPYEQAPEVHRYLWPFRTLLWLRREPNGNHKEIGLSWWEWSRFLRARYESQFRISFAFVATHNHFVLDRGGRSFKRTAPVIKLPEGATEDDHLALLGLLNSSTACFWMKQVFHDKGAGGIGGGYHTEKWSVRLEHDATKLRQFPVAGDAEAAIDYARALDQLATLRAEHSAAAYLSSDEAWTDAHTLRATFELRREENLSDLYRMVALQEELDWLAYRLYGLDEATEVVHPDDVEACPPTWLPWLLERANHDAEIEAARTRGEDPPELPTVWFKRHRWTPVTELPAECPPALRARIEARRARLREVPALKLIETAAFKRRWYQPDYEAEETEAMEAWLSDKIEAALEARGKHSTLPQLTAVLQSNPRVLAVAEVLTGRKDFDLASIVADRIAVDAVPNHPAHVYKPSGLTKRAAWEKTWEEQRKEDRGEPANPEVPPKYTGADFQKPIYYKLRGKLDVPKERFIALTEVPGRTGAETLYGWAGWTPTQRIRALLAIDEDLEDAGLDLTDRAGVLDSAWRLLPEAAREDEQVAARLRAELQALLGPGGPTSEMLADWGARFPPPNASKRRKRKS